MSSNDKLTRNELLLPNIILCNQMFVEAQRIKGQSKKSEARKRPANLQSTTGPGNSFIFIMILLKCSSTNSYL